MKQENSVTFFSKARMLQLWIEDDRGVDHCFKFDNHKLETSDPKKIKLLRNYLLSGSKSFYEIDEKEIIQAKEPAEVIIDGEIVKMEDLKGKFKQKSLQNQTVVKGSRTNFNAGDSVK